jgi:sulfur-carrier protein adenylyltransferase/sulfurtransferase
MAFMVVLGLIIAAVPQNSTSPYKLSAEELLSEVNSRERFIQPDAVAEMIINRDPSIRLIDVRSSDQFDSYSLTGAVNVPLANLLADDYRDLLDQDIKINIFYSNGTISANEAWLLTRQLGYKNNYVLEGGLNYWFENILNPQAPSSTSPSEEFARYDFRRSAAAALGGGEIVPTSGSAVPPPQMPSLRPSSARRTVSGGC